MSLPPNFKEKLLERKVIPFVGAGISMNVKDKNGNDLFPSWRNLLLASAEQLKTGGKEPEAKLVEGNLEINPPNYLEAAKMAQKYLGAEFYDLIKEKISPRYENVDQTSLRIPQIIWEINNNLIITTNYDKVLSWTCPNKEDLSRWNVEAPKEQADLIRTQFVRQPTVWHLHGHIDDVRNIILTPDGYEKLYPTSTNSQTKYEAARKTLETLFISHTFLFIGFSLDDEYFVNQLRYVQNLFQNTTNKHYVLVREAEKAKLNSLNLGIEPITFESFGDKMLEKLQEIRDEVNQSKTKITEDAGRVLSATEKYNPKNRVVHIPFNQKGDQVVGREKDLEEVRETLLKGFPTNIGQAVSFQGLGGLGKTQLAVEYGYKYQNEYPNGVIWLTVDQDIDKQLVEVSNKAGWVSPLSEIKVKLDAARHRLKTITDCLIVLDNVEIFDERIEDYLPESQNNNHILATSRYELAEFNRVFLDLLTLEQSVQMLKQESRREIEDENDQKIVEKIAEELGNLPLTLEIAGGFLRHRQAFTWGNYLLLLKQNPREAFKEKFLKGSFTRHDTDVYRTLKVSENILEEEPLLRDVLDLLTWSGTSPMGVDLMSKLLSKNEIELLEALSLGESLRLLQKSSERNAYAIHRLVAEVRKEDIPLGERIDWIGNICELLGDWFQDIRQDFNKLPEYEDELEHLAKWQKHAENFATENASRLLWLQGYPFYYRGKYKTAIEIVGEALKIHHQTKNENREILANLYNDFGSLSGDLGKYQEQFDNQKKSLDIRLELFGENHRNTASFFNNIGGAYGDLGKYEEEFNNHKKSLNIRLELYGENHPQTAISFYNLSFNYQKQKNYKTATEYAEKSFALFRNIYGNLHPYTLKSVIQLTDIYTEDKKGDKALRLIDEFLMIIPKSNPSHKKLENQKRWILEQTQTKGFRQQSINPAKKKIKKKRR